jgi:hypothetical protein
MRRRSDTLFADASETPPYTSRCYPQSSSPLVKAASRCWQSSYLIDIIATYFLIPEKKAGLAAKIELVSKNARGRTRVWRHLYPLPGSLYWCCGHKVQ